MTGKNFQAIYDKLSSTITEYWEKLIFRADYGHDNWSMMFYLVQEDGIIKDCYSMKGASRDKLIKLFIEINAELQEWRKIENWFVMTITVSRDGTFKTDFVYDDISENLGDFYTDWERKYLFRN